MKLNDVVMINQDVEVTPLNFVKKATMGKVIDFLLFQIMFVLSLPMEVTLGWIRNMLQ